MAMKDINKMTLGDIESLIEKRVGEVKKAMPTTYRDDATFERLQELWSAVNKLQEDKDYIIKKPEKSFDAYLEEKAIEYAQKAVEKANVLIGNDTVGAFAERSFKAGAQCQKYRAKNENIKVNL